MVTDTEFRRLLERVEKLEAAVPKRDACKHPAGNRSRDDPDFCLLCRTTVECGRCGAPLSKDQC